MKNMALTALALIMAFCITACVSQGAVQDDFSSQAAEVYPARYKSFELSYVPDPVYGDVLNAARGTASNGQKVMAILARSTRNHDSEGASDMGWDSQIPNPYRVLIVIDETTNKVVASRVAREGSNTTQFVVPEEKLAAYQEVAIDSETAFDGFTAGLVTGKQFDIELDVYELEVITGTSLIYTGATVQGTFSSQLVRNCFMTAARFYVNSK